MPYPNEAELMPMPTLGIEEFSKLYKDKLEEDFAFDLNQHLLNEDLDLVTSFNDYIELMYMTYLEDTIYDIYSPKK